MSKTCSYRFRSNDRNYERGCRNGKYLCKLCGVAGHCQKSCPWNKDRVPSVQAKLKFSTKKKRRSSSSRRKRVRSPSPSSESDEDYLPPSGSDPSSSSSFNSDHSNNGDDGIDKEYSSAADRDGYTQRPAGYDKPGPLSRQGRKRTLRKKAES